VKSGIKREDFFAPYQLKPEQVCSSPIALERGMVMNINRNDIQNTQHAFLVAWGGFAEYLGLPDRIKAIPLKQKNYIHSPQSKVLEFLVSILAGSRHMQEISLAAHPLDKDQAVAEAWGQASWADYSGVSRTQSKLSWLEVKQIAQELDQIGQPYITTELNLLCSQGARVRLDGDLTGLPVSDTSRTYPNAAFGYMDDEIRLGYQAAVVSMESPTYKRLWLSNTHHPGDIVSSTQAEALVLSAEARLKRKPKRRTELLRQRIAAFEQQIAEISKRREAQELILEQAKKRLSDGEQQQQERQQKLDRLSLAYQTHQRKERPTSSLTQARKRSQAAENRLKSRQKTWREAQTRLDKTKVCWQEQAAAISDLYKRLARFEQENATNSDPIEAEFRLDAGFGTYTNLALLIEMGYEVYTKPFSQKIVTMLKQKVTEQTNWTRVGANAELVAWSHLQLEKGPYPLDVALERFYTGKIVKHGALLHFGADQVATDLTTWFQHYNGRQTIEAGIKEEKQVFYLHHIKVRSEPAIYLQECFILFAANFIRWATHWLAKQEQPGENALNISGLGIKRQVQVGAHVSAQIIRISDGKLLRFNENSAFAGKVLKLPSARQQIPHRKFLDVLRRFLSNRL
jgi:hypothetical protein